MMQIKNVHYFDSDKMQVVTGDIFIKEGKFTTCTTREQIEKVIDGSKYLLLPSFQNAHTHVAMGLLRGYGSGRNLSSWLNDYIWPAEAKLTDEDVYWGTALGLLEMIASGTSAFMEMYDHAEAIAQATYESGMRANICRGSVGMFDESGKGISENNRLYDAWHGKEGRINVYYGPHAPNTCPPEYIKEMVKEAKARHTGIHIHLSETLGENQFILETYHKSPTAYLDSLGVFDLEKPTLVAHGIHLSEADKTILAKKNASLAHCPVSNMKLASGISDILSYSELGGLVCLGTDGASSNNTLDMLRELQTASLLHKVNKMNPEVLSELEAFMLATKNGAKALGFEKTGEIKEGYDADFMLMNIELPHHYPHHDLLANVAYSAKSSDIDYLFVKGKCLYEKGEYLTLDKDKILAKSKEIAKRLTS